MKDNLKELRLLEKATAAGNAPLDECDSEAASLREAWLAFGEMLEAAQPPASTSPLLYDEVPSVMASPAYRRPHWLRLAKAGLLAASLLVGVAAVWILQNANRQATTATAPVEIAMAGRKTTPSTTQTQPTQTHQTTSPTTEGSQWEDSLDDQFTQVGWQMISVQQNEQVRIDAVGLVQYRMEQFRQAIETDSL